MITIDELNVGLKKHREKIDRADRKLLEALSERFESVKKIGQFKQAHGMPLKQKSRWAQVMKARLELASNLKLNPDFIEKLYRFIHQEALRLQDEIVKSKMSGRSKRSKS